MLLTRCWPARIKNSGKLHNAFHIFHIHFISRKIVALLTNGLNHDIMHSLLFTLYIRWKRVCNFVNKDNFIMALCIRRENQRGILSFGEKCFTGHISVSSYDFYHHYPLLLNDDIAGSKLKFIIFLRKRMGNIIWLFRVFSTTIPPCHWNIFKRGSLSVKFAFGGINVTRKTRLMAKYRREVVRALPLLRRHNPCKRPEIRKEMR